MHKPPHPIRSKRYLLGLLSAIMMYPLQQAQAQNSWPERPIRLIVSFPVGGIADSIARVIAPYMAQMLGQPVTVDNRPGANGNIGIAEAVRAPQDGHTLLLTSGASISINPLIYGALPFNPQTDLVPIAALARVHLFLNTTPSVPATSVAEFIAYLQARPGELSYGSPGQGSSPHLAGEMFKRLAEVDALHVPYRGASPALNDILGGHLQFWFDPGVGLKQVDAGKLKMLAIGSPQRSALYPGIPTLAESGMPGFDADSLFGLYAPAGTPASIIQAVDASIASALQQQRVIDSIYSLGATPTPMDRQAFINHHAREQARFASLIEDVGLKVY
ncbi:MAG: tripartite tricarboxylate transporter substrate binding protein [Comamonas sp.]|jgi:tripartite-type tricarboxylate transporter receptor subunit TctC|nr:tripartite tricarboxylate transporter substrate binding protein [Comamonas sp.]